MRKIPGWIKYWDEAGLQLKNRLQENQISKALDYYSMSFAFFSYTVEDIDAKVSSHKETYKDIFILILELQDILRSVFICQQHLLLATSAGNLRTSFEIFCNLEFVYQHKDPKELMLRMKDFIRCEELIGRRLSTLLKPESEDDERDFANKHPYWKNKETGLLKNTAVWNGENLSFREIVKRIDKEEEYYNIFKIASKLVHGSPVVKNLYQNENGISCIGNVNQITYINVMCCSKILDALVSFSRFFEIPFNEEEYLKIRSCVIKLAEDFGLKKVTKGE